MSIRITFPLHPHLLPGEILKFEPTDYDRIKRYKGGDYEYAIYNNSELDEMQRELELLEGELLGQLLTALILLNCKRV